jgi:hypothetical protein
MVMDFSIDAVSMVLHLISVRKEADFLRLLFPKMPFPPVKLPSS